MEGSQKPVQKLGHHHLQRIVPHTVVPPNMKQTMEDQEQPERIELHDVDETNPVVCDTPIERWRNRQKTARLQQSRRRKAEQETANGNNKEAPDDDPMHPPVNPLSLGREFWRSLRGRSAPNKIRSPQQTKDHEHQRKIGMDQKSVFAQSMGFWRPNEHEPDEQWHHEPVNKF